MLARNKWSPRHKQAEEIILRAIAAIGPDLGGSKLDLLCDNMDGSTSELEGLLVAMGHRCGFCRKDKSPDEKCKGEHYISSSTEGY